MPIYNDASDMQRNGEIMQSRLKCEKPGEIEYTMTITMTAENWEKLRDQLNESRLSSSYPSWTFIRHINDLLGQARKIYWPTEPDAVSQ